MSKTDITHHKAVRGAYKGHCIQAIKRADRIMEGTESPNLTELEAIIERLARRMEEISILDNKIVTALEKKEDIMEETDQTLSFQDTIHFGILKMRKFLAQNQPTVSPFHYINPAQTKQNIHINLPKLQIQPFNGNPLEWLTFWDSFRNAVHENDSLHIFSDSSQLAYGAVAYIRCETSNGTKCAFLMSKSRVAPIKEQTLPRLELLGALLGAKLSNYLCKTVLHKLQPSRTVLWSDSQIALAWISRSKPLREGFIRHRVQLVKEFTSAIHSSWKYCPSASNPADLITRGLDGRSFMNKQR